jgi:CMP-N-acetylneuraminic acid synthetase
MELQGDRLVARAEPSRRQDKQILYARNGPAVLALRAATLGDELFGGDVRAFVMDERDSLDVDTLDDLELAALLLRDR